MTGRVAELKDNLNTMISNLRETTESNREQDWNGRREPQPW